MWTNDRYQTSLYFGLPVWTLSIIPGVDVIPEAPRVTYRPSTAAPPAAYRPLGVGLPTSYRPTNPTVPGG